MFDKTDEVEYDSGTADQNEMKYCKTLLSDIEKETGSRKRTQILMHIPYLHTHRPHRLFFKQRSVADQTASLTRRLRPEPQAICFSRHILYTVGAEIIWLTCKKSKAVERVPSS